MRHPPVKLQLGLITSDEQTRAQIRSVAEAKGWEIEDPNMADAAFCELEPGKAWGVAIIDVCQPGKGRSCGADWVRQIGVHRSQPHVLVLAPASCCCSSCALRCLLAGSKGVLPKPVSSEGLLAALADIARGEIIICREGLTDLAASLARAGRLFGLRTLTPRESEVVDCLQERLSDKEIATRLRVSAGTVHAHLKRIFHKLRIHKRSEAGRRAFRPN